MYGKAVCMLEWSCLALRGHWGGGWTGHPNKGPTCVWAPGPVYWSTFCSQWRPACLLALVQQGALEPSRNLRRERVWYSRRAPPQLSLEGR